MTKRKGKTLVEVFAAEQENACEQLDRIKWLACRPMSADDSEEVCRICDSVQNHLRGRRQRLASLVRDEPQSMESAMWSGRD